MNRVVRYPLSGIVASCSISYYKIFQKFLKFSRFPFKHQIEQLKGLHLTGQRTTDNQ